MAFCLLKIHNIVCFRNLQKRTDDALSLFGDKKAGGIALLRGYKDYYFGYADTEGKYHPGYRDIIEELTTEFPLSEEHITGEQHQKDFGKGGEPPLRDDSPPFKKYNHQYYSSAMDLAHF